MTRSRCFCASPHLPRRTAFMPLFHRESIWAGVAFSLTRETGVGVTVAGLGPAPQAGSRIKSNTDHLRSIIVLPRVTGRARGGIQEPRDGRPRLGSPNPGRRRWLPPERRARQREYLLAGPAPHQPPAGLDDQLPTSNPFGRIQQTRAPRRRNSRRPELVAPVRGRT